MQIVRDRSSHTPIQEDEPLKRPVVLLARVIGYTDTRYLVSQKQIFFPDFVREITQRFNFQKSPQTLEEHDLAKGVQFLEGHSGRRIIKKFVIWDSLLVLETTSCTDDSKALMEEILMWGVEKYGINYEPGSMNRFAYVSDINFFSDTSLLLFNPAVEKLTTKCSEALTEIWQESVDYQPTALKIAHDPTARKFGIAPFSLERRADASFSESKYFSEAPLPTHLHLELLEQYERDILRSGETEIS